MLTLTTYCKFTDMLQWMDNSRNEQSCTIENRKYLQSSKLDFCVSFIHSWSGSSLIVTLAGVD